MSGETLFGIGTAVFALGAVPLVARSFKEVGRLGVPARESIGSLAALLGAFGVGLHAAGAGIWLQAISLLLIKVGLVFLLVFTHSVFRPRSAISTTILTMGLAALGYSLYLDLGAVTRTGIPAASPAMGFGQLATGLPLAWVGVECVLSWRRQCRQALVGLGDPLVRNRFALGMVTGLSLTGVCAAKGLESLGVWGPGASASICGSLYLVAGPTVWLMFSPPRAYKAWLTASAAA